jgi:hypothetical protein
VFPGKIICANSASQKGKGPDISAGPFDGSVHIKQFERWISSLV